VIERAPIRRAGARLGGSASIPCVAAIATQGARGVIDACPLADRTEPHLHRRLIGSDLGGCGTASPCLARAAGDDPDAVDRDLDACYARADVFVLPTVHEGRMRSRRICLRPAVVSTRAGAVPETVPSDAGLLVPPADPAALREAVARVLDDAALRARLAEGARRARARLPDWDAACARLAAVLTIDSANLERLHD
jgi:glycosyltransferase involved in cell wall biosynthesis